MRRNDREVKDILKIHEIMDSCYCCRLGFYNNGQIYILPLNFGYIYNENTTTLYFHGAKEGKKITLINEEDTVGFEMDTAYKLSKHELACRHSAKFKSIIGNGNISFVNDKTEKTLALKRIMYHNTKKTDWDFSPLMLDNVTVFKVVVTNISCKVHE